MTSLLKAQRKTDALIRLQESPEGIRFTEQQMQQVTILAWTLGDRDMGVLMTVAYSFLLRLQSDMLGLEAGSEAELTCGMPPSRHSAACVKDGRLHIRLKVRKH